MQCDLDQICLHLLLFRTFLLFSYINYCHYLMKYDQICSRVSSGKFKDGQHEKLFIKKDSSSVDSPSQLYVDTAVYSRNRCFRLALSSKVGKSYVLLPTGNFKAKDMVWYISSQARPI